MPDHEWRAKIDAGMAEAKAEAAEAKAEAAEAKAMAAEAMAMAEAMEAKATAAEAKATAEALTEKLALYHRARVAAIDRKLRRLKELRESFEQLVRCEELVRIMRCNLLSIDALTKDLLSDEDIAFLKKARVAHLLQVEQYKVLPGVEALANKLRDSLPAATVTQDLLAFCASAAYHYGKVSHTLQHPVPTLQYAKEVLSAISCDAQGPTTRIELDVDVQLFASEDSEGFGPRQQIEDEIADLEIEKAMMSESLA
ncbi:hypothetical protein GGX14DRAFT_669710 [Mycena pura]|uniref:Uncharacterized protein n=1 Tax=Mycena pura TaxID=153505 RepID=A0AAD6VTB3_9AGAR|nr:hypothetical protein GGX14DRAFT_669710 [Mycena pura]